MVRFPLNVTHRFQPLDVSSFGPLKTYYNEAYDNFSVTSWAAYNQLQQL